MGNLKLITSLKATSNL